jgi:chromosome segregation ATPase
MTAPSSEVRETPTTDALLAEVREGVAAIVRDALAEAERLREQADETLERYDAVTSELARLRVETHGLRHELEELPGRLHTAKLDALVPDSHGEEPEALERRYVAARERLPVAEARIARLEAQLVAITSGGSRPAKVRNERHLLKHTAREPALEVLNETATALERLRDQLPDVVKAATADILKERDSLRDGQNQLWGLAKAQR